MDGEKGKVLKTIADPDLIQQGDFEELIGIRFYKKTPGIFLNSSTKT